jgi:hypothetical protein
MDNLTIKTNGQYRNLIYGYEITEKEQADFDYISDEDMQGRGFIRYRGRLYDAGDMMRAPSDMPEWDGVVSDSYFSGVLFRFSSDGERVKCATYYS